MAAEKFGQRFSKGLWIKTQESEGFYSSHHRTMSFNLHFYKKKDDKPLVRLKYILVFQSIFSTLMKYPEDKFQQWLSTHHIVQRYRSREYGSLNTTMFQMIKNFFFCFWSELYIIFDWRQGIRLFTRRKFFILSARKKKTKQNPRTLYFMFLTTDL